MRLSEPILGAVSATSLSVRRDTAAHLIQEGFFSITRHGWRMLSNLRCHCLRKSMSAEMAAGKGLARQRECILSVL